MNEYLVPGTINRLKIVRDTDYGFVLCSAKEKEVLLPKRYKENWMQIGGVVDLFVYYDSEDRLVATTERPVALLGEAAKMHIVDTTSHGAFADWGLAKDLFIPKREQQERLKKGDEAIVMVMEDPRTGRLFGTQKLQKGFNRKPALKRNQEVSLLIFGKTDLGYKAVVEKRYEGLIFHSELFEPIEVGQTMKGYVKQIRKDGKIDLLTRPIGKKSDTLAMDKVMQHLRANGGSSTLHYKSSPETIQQTLGLSRKNFKRALSALRDKGIVAVTSEGSSLCRRKR